MNFKEKLVVRLLLLTARILAPEPWAKEIGDLARDIHLYARETQ